SMVGNAVCTLMLSRVEEWIQAPDAPNLYWALTNLPRPLIDLRKSLEGEMLMLEAEFPDLRTLERETLSPQAQQRLLKKLNDPEYGDGRGDRPAWQKPRGCLGSGVR